MRAFEISRKIPNRGRLEELRSCGAFEVIWSVLGQKK
jgi:hypothetical protein